MGPSKNTKVCYVCGRFVKKNFYSSHIKLHSETGIEDACPVCGRTGFKMKSQLNEHVKRVHERQKRHFCDQCTFSSFKSTNLTKHLKNVHQKEQQKCPECGKLVKHMY